MLKFGNKEFRNLEEQVGKNQQDIERLAAGIKIEKWLYLNQLSSYITEANLGKYYIVVKDDNSQHLYLITQRNNGGLTAVDLGKYPAGEVGPQGPKGEKGDKGDTVVGPQGPQGLQGAPGRGVNSLSAIDATSYTQTFTDLGSGLVKCETSADVEFGQDPAKKIDFDFTYKVPTDFYSKSEVDDLIDGAKADVLDDAESYADTQIGIAIDDLSDTIDATLTNYASKGYVNSRINTELANYYNTTEVDALEAATLQSAKDYTDQQIAAIAPTDVTKTYVDNQDAATLQSAKDYTDTVVGDINTILEALL